MNIALKCANPECGSFHIIKDGFKRGKQRYTCQTCGSCRMPIEVDLDVAEAGNVLARKAQRFQDTNRIERKLFRESARISNALKEYEKELIQILKKRGFTRRQKKPKVNSTGAGILHASDWHLNELVDLPTNRFDFKKASQRIMKYVDVSKKFLDVFNVNNLLIAITGDLLNSDRRLDEMLNHFLTKEEYETCAKLLEIKEYIRKEVKRTTA